MRARDLMTTSLVTIPPDAPLDAVARVLADRGISGAPVVDAEGCCVGIVAQADVARAALNGGDVTPSDVATVVERVSRPTRWRSTWSNYQPPL